MPDQFGRKLVDLDANFVGMNSYPSYQKMEKMTPFIQRVLICKLMVKKGIVRRGGLSIGLMQVLQGKDIQVCLISVSAPDAPDPQGSDHASNSTAQRPTRQKRPNP